MPSCVGLIEIDMKHAKCHANKTQMPRCSNEYAHLLVHIVLRRSTEEGNYWIITKHVLFKISKYLLQNSTRGIWKVLSMVFYLNNQFTNPIMFGIVLKSYFFSLL